MRAVKSMIRSIFSMLWLGMAAGFASAATITVVTAGTGTGVVTSNFGSINCGATCSGSVASGTALVLTATPGLGQRFMGWLGPCADDSTCNFIVSADVTAIATFAPSIVGAPTLDIDGSSSCGPLTDGLLLMRYLLGLPTTASMTAANEPSALRLSPQDVGDYLLNVTPALDVDGNGQADAATDGVLIVRYLFGLRGSALTAGSVVGSGATRPLAGDIEARIVGLCSTFPSSYALNASKLGPGTGTISSGVPGIACGADCAQNYIAGALVTLDAAPAVGSFFAGWGGACTGSGSCNVSMTAAKNVSAFFTQVTPGCAPSADVPDVALVDANCDGIDGDIAASFFVSKSGSDSNPGNIAEPFLTVQKGVDSAFADALRKNVLVSNGTYDEVVQARSGVSVYGAYDANWQRSLALAGSTLIRGSPQALLANGATGINVQLLALLGTQSIAPGSSVYGVRAINGSDITLTSVIVTASNARAGANGSTGVSGANASNGAAGVPGGCDQPAGAGGAGGASAAGRTGGGGGVGGAVSSSVKLAGAPGGGGVGGTLGGTGGAGGDPGAPGGNGGNGANGSNGASGAGGTSTLLNAGATWVGANGSSGTSATPGNGGGGGGGGGNQSCTFCISGGGNGGGGGGGGGGAGTGGTAGSYGGGSFAIYLFNSIATVNAGSVVSGAGGKGGDGGVGGLAGQGGSAGPGGTACLSEVGRGGNGGTGGDGGAGGAGGGAAGGPSIGVFRAGTSTVNVVNSPGFITGVPGAGGTGGGSTGISGSIIQQ